MTSRRRTGFLGVVLGGVAVVALAASCSRAPAAGGGGGAGGDAGVKVVCTTGMIADAARAIGGDRVRVTQLMGEGVDPHLYRASPGDMRLVREAGVVLSNGLHLEGRMGEVLESPGPGVVAKAVGEAIPEERLMRPPGFQGQHDPHVWFDVALWIHAVGAVRDALVEADGSGRAAYESAAAGYIGELEELDQWCREQLGSIPLERRVLVTAHDAFGYFGRAYGIEVLAIQGVSTDSESGVGDINRLVDLIVARKVPAVFVESSVPRKLVEALVEGCASRGQTVRIGGELFSDAMGAPGTPEGTYQGMVRHNVRMIVEALAPGAGG